MKKNMKALLLAATASVLALPCAAISRAADAPPNLSGTLRDTQSRQEQIQSESQAVVDQIDGILAEYKQHGMENREDVKTLNVIRTTMQTMSADEMKQVIGMLQQASKASTTDAALHQSAAVSVAQGDIVSKLKTLILLHARQEKQYDLAAEFVALAKRQDTNLNDLLNANHSDALRYNEGAMHDVMNLQRMQQIQLATDVKAALTDLTTLVAANDAAPGEEPPVDAGQGDATTSDRTQSAINQANNDKLGDNVTLASTELLANHIFQAATSEKISRDSLREIARLLVLPLDAISRLEESLKDIDQVIADQTQLTSDTLDVTQHKPGAMKNGDLDVKQENTADATDQIKKNVDGVSPKAVQDLILAMAQMQATREDIQGYRYTPAIAKQNVAIDDLQQAKKDLADQVAKLEKQQDTDESKLDKAKDLVTQTSALKQKEIALEKKTEQAADPKQQQEAEKQQAELQQTAVDLQQQAMDTTPTAAPDMQNAATKMDDAAKNLSKTVNDKTSAVEQQKDAIAAIEKAQTKMGENVAKMEQEQKDVEAIDKAMLELGRIIVAQQKIGSDTDIAVAQKNDSLVQPLAIDQTELVQRTQMLRDGLPPTASTAVPPLTDAMKDMGQSSTALAKPNAANSVPPEHQALVDLMKAKEELAKKKDELNDDLGKPKDDSNALTDASEKLDKAIQETNDATQDMQSTPDSQSDAIKDLQKRQEQISKQLNDMQNSPAASTPLGQAQQKSNQAATDLSQNDPAKAAEAMHQASQAMQNAEQPQKGDQPSPTPPSAGQAAAMKDLEAKQQQLEKEATALGQQAAKELADAAKQVGDINASDQGDLPKDAGQALQEAQKDLSQAAAEAKAGQSSQAQQSAQSASQAMSQAKASMAAAQGKSDQPTPGKGPSSKGPPGSKPGKPGDKPGKTNENMAMKGKGNRKDIGKGTTDGGPRNVVASGGQYVGLPPRDRAALQQSRAEKYPQEYAPQIEQYLKNLSDDDTKN